MDQVGASHITTPDLIIVGVAAFLIFLLLTRPPNSVSARVAAVLSSVAVAVNIGIMLVVQPGVRGVMLLAYISIKLCWVLGIWNDKRRKQNFIFNSVPHRQQMTH